MRAILVVEIYQSRPDDTQEGREDVVILHREIETPHVFQPFDTIMGVGIALDKHAIFLVSDRKYHYPTDTWIYYGYDNRHRKGVHELSALYLEAGWVAGDYVIL